MTAGRGLGIVSNAIDQILVRVMFEVLGAVGELTPRCFRYEALGGYKCVFGVVCLFDRDEYNGCCIVTADTPRRDISLPIHTARKLFPGRVRNHTFGDPNGMTKASPHMRE